MKKLMIALAAVAIGMATNAASFTWKVQSGYIWDGAETPAKITSGSAYLVFASALTQSDLVTAFAADAATAASTVSSKAVSTGTIGSNARIAETAFTSDVTSDQTASPISFGSVTSSSKAFNDVAGGYTSAGWYGAVPEPTSGLLMLLGMAGLALRRKRA